MNLEGMLIKDLLVSSCITFYRECYFKIDTTYNITCDFDGSADLWVADWIYMVCEF